jgi:tRNA(Ile)-lysidine synthase TilS/MesJ
MEGTFNTQEILQKWLSHNKKYLESVSQKKLLVTFSGGKDSSACLYLLNKVKEQFNFNIEAHLYAFPKHIYPDNLEKTLLAYWEQEKIFLFYYQADQEDDVLDKSVNPCRLCQNIRKKVLFNLFSKRKEPFHRLVIVSAHSLWDMAGYALETFITTELSESQNHYMNSEERRLEIGQRFYPYIIMKEGYTVFRPMLCLNQNEINRILEEANIPVQESTCRYKRLRPKKVLGNYFETFGHEFSYEGVLKFAQKHLDIPDLSTIKQIAKQEYLLRRF